MFRPFEAHIVIVADLDTLSRFDGNFSRFNLRQHVADTMSLGILEFPSPQASLLGRQQIQCSYTDLEELIHFLKRSPVELGHEEDGDHGGSGSETHHDVSDFGAEIGVRG